MINLPVHFIIRAFFVLLVFQFNLAESENCYEPTNSINNKYFRISCQKSIDRITITCHEPDTWKSFLRVNVTLENIKRVVIQNCSLSQGQTLFDFTGSLIKIEQIEDVSFRNSKKSSPTRDFFGGFTKLKEVIIYDQNFLDLPTDLFGGVEVERFMIKKAGIARIPSGFFKNSKNPKSLKYLGIVYTNLTKLRRNDFSGLEKLKTLWLFNNEISEIEDHAFDSLADLQILQLTSNKLKTLPSHIFKKLVKLENLSVGKNEFNFLPPDLLHLNGSRLRKLKLNHNRGELATVPNEFFKNLTKLRYVELVGNDFTSLPNGTFNRTFSLHTLNLNNNSLITLPPGIFNYTKKLEILHVSFNKLKWLPKRIFKDTQLNILTLDHNRLSDIPSNVLLGSENFIEKKASNDRIFCIHKDFLKQLDKSEREEFVNINVTRELDKYNFSIFVNCSRLEKLDLSYNQIEQTSTIWYHSDLLQKVNYEGNDINELMLEQFISLNDGLEVNFKNNKIHTIHLDYKKLSTQNLKMTEVLLDKNPLNCTCDILGIFQYFQNKFSNEREEFKLEIQADELKCYDPSKLKNFDIKNIRPEDLNC